MIFDFGRYLIKQLTSGNFNTNLSLENKLLEPKRIALFNSVSVKYVEKNLSTMW